MLPSPAGFPSSSAADDPPRFSADISSTPFVSPSHASPSAYFFSAPATPMHHLLQKPHYEPVFLTPDSGSFEFEFSSRFSPNGSAGNGLMSSADELFCNGLIKPTMKLPPHHRKTRSMSPLRMDFDRQAAATNGTKGNETDESSETTPSSSRSSSYGRNSKKWMFLKDLLHRSKSEGRADGFWSAISFSPAKKSTLSRDEKKVPAENGVGRRRSAHELHYAANRAQAEEMRKRTFLPYRQGLLGCLGFGSKSYGAFGGFTRSLNPISSR